MATQTKTTQVKVIKPKPKRTKPKNNKAKPNNNNNNTTKTVIVNKVENLAKHVTREILECPYALILIAPFIEGLPTMCYKQPTDSIGNSCVYVSKQITEIIFNGGAGVNGRFAACIQPKIGYKNVGTNLSGGESVMATTGSTDWTTAADWRKTTQYLTSGFVDPQFDDYINKWDRYQATTTSAATQTIAKPFGNGLTPDNTTTAKNLVTYSSATNSVFSFAPGDYSYSGYVQITSGPAAGITITAANATNTNGPYSSLAASADQTLILFKGSVHVDDGQIGTLTFSIASGTVSLVTASQISIQMIPGPLGDSGMMEGYKVVAMANLTSYVGDIVRSGGEISTYFAPHGVAQSGFSQNYSASLGQLQFYENLGQTMTAKKFAIRYGSYAWWSPEDAEDKMFKSPTDRINLEPATLIVAGNYTNTDAVLTGVVRLETYKIYEYKTRSRIPTQTCMNNELNQLGLACHLLRTFPRITENANHKKIISQFLKETNIGARVPTGAGMNGGMVAKGMSEFLAPLVPLASILAAFL